MTITLDGSGLSIEKLTQIARHGEKADERTGRDSLV